MSSEPINDPKDNSPSTPFTNSVDWELRQGTPVRRFLNGLEKVSLFIEKPLSKVFQKPVFNPLYHTGTITSFLLLVILATGVYLTFFYQFGFDSSYLAVLNIEANFVGRFMRALHRYASGLAVFTALLHGWRTFFQDRFRGPRWLAWVSGIGMSAGVWFIGITGYWLVWDDRARIITQTFINLVDDSGLGVSFLIKYLVSDAATTGWVFIILVITIHLGLSAVVGLFFWWHIKRLNRPKFLPPRFWMYIIGGLLLLSAVLVPVGMLPKASFENIPSEIPLDLFFLFYIPAIINISPIWFWGGVVLLVGVLIAIPWLLVRKPLLPIYVSAERCIGCTLCETDCPYKAISMVERMDDSGHKFLAVVDPDFCVACGVCVGSCPTLALTLGQQPAEALWQDAVALAAQRTDRPMKVVFTCERHAFQGARPYLNQPDSYIIPVTCVGMIHPNLLTQTLDAGAAEVMIIGCPPEDCANREGNTHLQERLDGNRKPILRSRYAGAPIRAHWLAPNAFDPSLNPGDHNTPATAYDFPFRNWNWMSFIPGLVLLMVVLGFQILASAIPYRPAIADQSEIQLIMNHRAGYPIDDYVSKLEPRLGVRADTRLLLEIDNQTWLDKSFSPKGRELRSKIFELIQIYPDEYLIRLIMFDREDQMAAQILFEEKVTLLAGQVLILKFEDGSVGKDPEAGEKLYNETSLGTNASCRICHSLEPGDDLVGPSFAGIATRAGSRIPGLSAEEYLRQSIVDPDAFIVDGFPSGMMVPNFDETLSDAQIDDLVAFLMSLP